MSYQKARGEMNVEDSSRRRLREYSRTYTEQFQFRTRLSSARTDMLRDTVSKKKWDSTVVLRWDLLKRLRLLKSSYYSDSPRWPTAYLNFSTLHNEQDENNLPKVLLKGLYISSLSSSSSSTTTTSSRAFREVMSSNANWDLSLLSDLRNLTMKSKHLALLYVLNARTHTHTQSNTHSETHTRYGCVMDAKRSINGTNRYLVTEFCEGGSLKDGIAWRSKHLRKDMRCSVSVATWGERLGWALDISSALSYLKKNELYHGNLKSSNCMLYLSKKQIFIMSKRESISLLDSSSRQKRKVRRKRITFHDIYMAAKHVLTCAEDKTQRHFYKMMYSIPHRIKVTDLELSHEILTHNAELNNRT